MTVRESIDRILRRVGSQHRETVQRVTARLSDDQLAALAQRNDVRTLDALRQYVGAVKQGRRPSTPPDQRFFQRYVVGHVVETVNGERRVVAWKLGCGHVVPTHRRVLPTTKTKAVPCPSCGSGTRTPFERRRAEEHFAAAFDRVWGRPEHRAHFVALLQGLTALTSLSPLDRRQSRVRADVSSALRALGLVAVEGEEAR